MPIYEYSCHRCGQKFEVRQKFADEPLKIHQECGGEAERLISRPSLHFKGSGWYVTDYAKTGHSSEPSGSNGHADSKGGESQGESKTESKSDSKSESKSEAKSDSKTESRSESKPDSKSESKPAPAKTGS